MRKISYGQAVSEALLEEFRRDEKTVHLSTDIPPELRSEFGEARIRQTPISESSFVGGAIGLAGSGFRPVVDIRMATFGFVAGQIPNRISHDRGCQQIFRRPAFNQPLLNVYECTGIKNYSAIHPL